MTRTVVEETVLASGAIEASQLVSVGAGGSRAASTLNVAFGDGVRTGDVIAEIELP